MAVSGWSRSTDRRTTGTSSKGRDQRTERHGEDGREDIGQGHGHGHEKGLESVLCDSHRVHPRFFPCPCLCPCPCPMSFSSSPACAPARSSVLWLLSSDLCHCWREYAASESGLAADRAHARRPGAGDQLQRASTGP